MYWQAPPSGRKRKTAQPSPRRLRGLLPGWRALGRWALRLLLLWLIATGFIVLLLRFVPPWTSAVMVERQITARIDHEAGFRLRQHWVPWSQVSPWVPLALVAAEDQKFPYHHGFDFAAIRSALTAAGEGERLRGASTISQQTAKNLFLWSGRSWLRKALEAYFTALMELAWPKQRILEVYLNIAEFGNGIYGVGAASAAYFHTNPARITPAQAARLAAVLPNPRVFHVDRPSGYVRQRSAWILRQMRQLGGPAYVEDMGAAR